MLVLTRRKGEAIMLGDDVEVRILDVSRHQVKVGVTAPRSLPVYRKELYEKIRGERQRAESSGGVAVYGMEKLFTGVKDGE